jgi:SsrA-binding protein
MSKHKVIANNKKARFEYSFEETIEAGLVLVGSEVKSLRLGKVSIQEAFADIIEGELHIINMTIPEYPGANRFNHDPRRPRKLLLHKRQINKLIGKITKKGMTIVISSLYFNDKNVVKAEIVLAKGKKMHDKRASEKERDWNREKSRLMKNNSF